MHLCALSLLAIFFCFDEKIAMNMLVDFQNYPTIIGIPASTAEIVSLVVNY